MNSMMIALVNTGMAISTSTAVARTVQVSSDIRKRSSGRAHLEDRDQKLTAPRIELVPTRANPTIHRSCPDPVDEPERKRAVGGPAGFGRAPVKKPRKIRKPPSGNIQKDSALMRGKAMSGAPTWSGTT